MLLRLLPYHARLAAKSLRRDPALSAAVVLVMALVASIWCLSIMHYLRIYGPRPALSPALSQVEIPVSSRTLQQAFEGTPGAGSILAARTRVSYPMYQALASSGIPARQTATFRSRLLVQRDDGGAPAEPPQNVRFVDADFFSMFALPMRWGAAWTRRDEQQGVATVVLGQQLNLRFFGGGDSVGRTILIDGRRFRIAGVLGQDQPFLPEWDIASSGGRQEVVYLPLPEHRRFQARPETPLYMAPIGPAYADLLASDTVFVSFWIDLPTAQSRADYARFLDQRLSARGVPFQLRDLPAFRATFDAPTSAISFYVLLGLIILIGGGVIMTRLLLAKGLARRDELGIFRAAGAPRRALFGRQLLEALMLSSAAAVLGLALALPQAGFYNRWVGDTDIPVVLTPIAFFITVGSTVGVGLASAIYPAWRAAGARPTVVQGRL